MKNDKTIQRIDNQIARIEDIIEQLLDGIDISELTTANRLTLVSRFLTTWQRGIALRQTCELDKPENKQGVLIAAFMRQMRGETQSQEALRIIEDIPLQEIEGPEETHG